MKKYYCKECNFFTELYQTMNRHLQSRKHKNSCKNPTKSDIEKNDVEKYKVEIYSCRSCHMDFLNKTARWKHENLCIVSDKTDKTYQSDKPDKPDKVDAKKEIKINDTVDIVTTNVVQAVMKQNQMLMKQMEVQIEENAKQREAYQEMMKTVAEFAKENTGITKKSMNMLKHANSYILNSKPMKKLERKEAYVLIGYDNPSKEITPEEIEKHVRIYVSKYQNNCFVQYVGDIIVSYYKPDKKENSNILTTDVSRLSFIILQKVDKAVNANEKEWVNDKSGKRFTNLVLVPLLNTIKDSLSAHVQASLKKDNKKLSSEEKIDLSNFLTDCNKLKRELDNDKFIVPILKYVAPSFRFDSFEIELKRNTYSSDSSDSSDDSKGSNNNENSDDILSNNLSPDDCDVFRYGTNNANDTNKRNNIKKKSSQSSYDIPKKRKQIKKVEK